MTPWYFDGEVEEVVRQAFLAGYKFKMPEGQPTSDKHVLRYGSDYWLQVIKGREHSG